MKHKRIVPSAKPVTSIRVAGKPYHYFHSDALGKCRAILISDDENLPRPTTQSHRQMIDEMIDEFEAEIAAKKAPKQLSKGEKLELLMNCSERLNGRLGRYFANYMQASDHESKNYWWSKVRATQKANTRVLAKIGLLFVENQL